MGCRTKIKRESGLFRLAVFIAVACGLGLGSLPARAENPFIIRKPSYNWNGFWWGGHLGASWPELLAPPAEGSISKGARFSGGLGAGYDREFSRVVFGVSGDTDLTSVNLEGPLYLPTATPSLFVPKVLVRSKIEWLTTLRARIGVRFERFMPYATGGLAIAKVKTSMQPYASSRPLKFTPASSDSWETGFVVGAGVEYRLGRYDTIGVEYLYYQIDSASFATVPQNVNLETELRGHIVRATFRYRF